MPDPKEVYDDPGSFWSLLTAEADATFEGQHFDRKEACRPTSGSNVARSQVTNLIEQIQECISAFANANKEGGLLVLGISTDGKIKGVNHLSESQLNSVLDLKTYLLNHAARSKLVECQDEVNTTNKICLIHVPHTERAFCETPGNSAKAYMREGYKNTLMDDAQRERVKREKGIVDFENTYSFPK